MQKKRGKGFKDEDGDEEVKKEDKEGGTKVKKRKKMKNKNEEEKTAQMKKCGRKGEKDSRMTKETKK